MGSMIQWQAKKDVVAYFFISKVCQLMLFPPNGLSDFWTSGFFPIFAEKKGTTTYLPQKMAKQTRLWWDFVQLKGWMTGAVDQLLGWVSDGYMHTSCAGLKRRLCMSTQIHISLPLHVYRYNTYIYIYYVYTYNMIIYKIHIHTSTYKYKDTDIENTYVHAYMRSYIKLDWYHQE